MKHVILLVGILAWVAATHIVFAQQEGTIDYEVKVNVHRTLPAERAEMKEMIPEFNAHKNKLLFNTSESLFVNVDEEEEEEDEFGGEGGGQMQVKMRRPMNEFYYNYSTGKRVAMMEFLGKYFLIQDSVKVTPWKLADETKSILGHTCKKATYYNSDRKQNVTAWYAAGLPPFLGPETFNNLPGTILEIELNNGERSISAKKISLEKLKEGALMPPAKGQKSTEAAFRKIVEEQRARNGRNGNVIIRH